MRRGIALPALAGPVSPGPLLAAWALVRCLLRRWTLGGPFLNHRSLAWTFVLLLLGTLSVTQWRSAPQIAGAADSSRYTATQTIVQLEAEQATLKQQISELRARLAVFEQRAARERGTRGELARGLERERLAAGVVPLRGTGIRVVVDDTSVKTLPAGEDPNRFIVHEYELRDLVNLLWLSGAEAMAINGERLVASTSIYCVGTTILVNDTRLSPPFEIAVIGDAAGLERAINDPQALRAFKETVRRYSLVFAVSREREVRVPAFAGGFPFKYAQPGSSS